MKTILALALVAAVGAAAGCRKKEPPAPPPAPAPEPPKPAPKPAAPAKPALAPPLTPAQKAEMERVFAEARKLVTQAMKLKSEGELIERSQGREAANDTLVKARDLFREACEMTEDWIEPELGKVTEAQVKDHLSAYFDERGKWQKLNSDMGKLHKD